MFRSAVHAFNMACDHFIETKDSSSWPASLRVKAVVNAPGIFEMTWSFSGPDGRATWQWVTVTDDHGDQLPAVRWRRLGNHNIFREP
ncbi:MAG: hypothetical protein M0Z45_02810 [Actinomycetota bacterium]|nr:hypothetical protein [Actinomycetota bacterium]